MACLPDEVWTDALQAGVRSGVLDYRDLCCLSIASRPLNRLASLASLWKLLFLRDFPHDSSTLPLTSTDYKATYKARFEKIKAAKVAAHKRQLLRLQSEGAVLESESKNLEKQIQEERSKFSRILVELKSLEQIRRSSTALRLWQPEIVRSMQHQLVEQQPVDSEFRQRSLEMEAKLCKEEIKQCSAGIARKRHALERVKKDLEFLTYNPIQDLHEAKPAKRPKKQSKVEKHKTRT
eukprot:c15582_g1_i1 orf=34-741(+)